MMGKLNDSDSPFPSPPPPPKWPAETLGWVSFRAVFEGNVDLSMGCFPLACYRLLRRAPSKGRVRSSGSSWKGLSRGRCPISTGRLGVSPHASTGARQGKTALGRAWSSEASVR